MMWVTPIVLAIKDYELESIMACIIIGLFTLIFVIAMTSI